MPGIDGGCLSRVEDPDAVFVAGGRKIAAVNSENVGVGEKCRHARIIVRKGEVWTSTGDYCLNGVTRQNVIDLCLANGIPVSERNYSLVETYSADEAFLTGSFGGQTPVGEIDGHLIGDGSLPGPITRKLQSLYKDLITKKIAVLLAKIRGLQS